MNTLIVLLMRKSSYMADRISKLQLHHMNKYNKQKEQQVKASLWKAD